MENVIAKVNLTEDEQKMFRLLALVHQSKKVTKSYEEAYTLAKNCVKKSGVEVVLPDLESSDWKHGERPPLNGRGDKNFYKSFVTGHFSFFIGMNGALSINVHQQHHQVFSSRPGTDGRHWFGIEKSYAEETYTTHLESLTKPVEQ